MRCRATCHGRVLRRAGGSGRRPPRGTAAGEGAGTEAQAPSVADLPIAPLIGDLSYTRTTTEIWRLFSLFIYLGCIL